MKRASWFVVLGVLIVAGGYVQPFGNADDDLDAGWNISGGVIFRPMPAKPFGVRLDLGYSSMDANKNAINLGNAADYLVDGGYLAVGGGGYRRYAALTANVI